MAARAGAGSTDEKSPLPPGFCAGPEEPEPLPMSPFTPLRRADPLPEPGAQGRAMQPLRPADPVLTAASTPCGGTEELADALRKLVRSAAPSPMHEQKEATTIRKPELRPRSAPALRPTQRSGDHLPPMPLVPLQPGAVPSLSLAVPARRQLELKDPVEVSKIALTDQASSQVSLRAAATGKDVSDISIDQSPPPLCNGSEVEGVFIDQTNSPPPLGADSGAKKVCLVKQEEPAGMAQSVASLREFFVGYAADLRLDKARAERAAQLLIEQELLFTTEDLYLLRDRELYYQLPLPIHIRRWLFSERDGVLWNPWADGRLSGAAVAAASPAEDELAALQRATFPHVEVTIQLNTLSHLNVVEMSFEADFTLMLDWKDPSAIGMTADDVEHADLFNPDVVLNNCMDDDHPLEGANFRPRIHKGKNGLCSDGHLKRTSRYRVRLAVPDMDLRSFPFDTQLLPIRLKARNHRGLDKEGSANDFPVVLVGPEGTTGTNATDGLRKSGHSADCHADQLSEWQIHSLLGLRSEKANRFYEMQIVILRDPGHVMWNVAFPTMMILLFGFTVYGMPIAEVGTRLEITATLLLAMMAFQGTIKDMLPPMPYLTAMGKYVIATFVVLLFHGFEHAFVFILTSGSTEDPWRSRPADYFFGTIQFWDETSEDPVFGECVWVICELCALILMHVVFFWYTYRARQQGLYRRESLAETPGVCLVPGPPSWGKSTTSNSTSSRSSTSWWHRGRSQSSWLK
mmetsp:Transcript_1444/g.3280  ORF Transcript_1444/g.3280 Transcript_1444/m.3280 type:complete len:744 (-) Transcript_1444:77-2308(-)